MQTAKTHIYRGIVFIEVRFKQGRLYWYRRVRGSKTREMPCSELPIKGVRAGGDAVYIVIFAGQGSLEGDQDSMAKVMAVAQELVEFINASPTAFHAVGDSLSLSLALSPLTVSHLISAVELWYRLAFRFIRQNDGVNPNLRSSNPSPAKAFVGLVFRSSSSHFISTGSKTVALFQ